MRIKHIYINDAEIQCTTMRAQGAGGQNVNKVSSAVHLKFDIPASSLPESVKARLLMGADSRLTKEGVLVIKSQQTRSQLKNKQIAMQRLHDFIASALEQRKVRKKTRPTKASRQRRLQTKTKRAELKKNRAKVDLS